MRSSLAFRSARLLAVLAVLSGGPIAGAAAAFPGDLLGGSAEQAEPGAAPAALPWDEGKAAQDRDEPPLQFAQADCSAAAAQAAAQSGGQVLSVSSREQNGRTVCVVTVLVPGRDGGRPRRTTITIPG